jgi:hypothetical protein
MFFGKLYMFSQKVDMFSQDLYIKVTDKGIKRKRVMLIQA